MEEAIHSVNRVSMELWTLIMEVCGLPHATGWKGEEF